MDLVKPVLASQVRTIARRNPFDAMRRAQLVFEFTSPHQPELDVQEVLIERKLPPKRPPSPCK